MGNMITDVFLGKNKATIKDFITEKFQIINCLPINAYVEARINVFYKKLLTDILEHTSGIEDEEMKFYYDNVLVLQENKTGLISLLSCGLTEQKAVYIVYDKKLGFSKATEEQQKEIEDLKGLKNGCKADFCKYKLTDLLKFIFTLDYYIAMGVAKQVFVSQSIGLKLNKLTDLVGMDEKESVLIQAKAITDAINNGSDYIMDKDSSVATMTLDVKPIAEAKDYITALACELTLFPASYFTGVANTGLSDTGNATSVAVEKALKYYFFSIWKPVIEKCVSSKIVRYITDNSYKQDLMLKNLFVVENSSLFSDEQKKFYADQIIPEQADKPQTDAQELEDEEDEEV